MFYLELRRFIMKYLMTVILICSVLMCSCNNGDYVDTAKDTNTAEVTNENTDIGENTDAVTTQINDTNTAVEESSAVSDEETNDGDAVTDEITDTDKAEITEEISESKKTDNEIPSDGGERPLLTVESFEDYLKVIDTQKIPENFVQYEKINKLGEFKCLVFLNDDNSSYMYTLADSTGYQLALYVDHNTAENDYDSADFITNVKSKDMRTLDDKNSGIFVTNGITYRYVSGKLLSINWVDGEVSFKLSGSSMLYDYPIEKSTFVCKLLNANEAVGAILETK